MILSIHFWQLLQLALVLLQYGGKQEKRKTPKIVKSKQKQQNKTLQKLGEGKRKPQFAGSPQGCWSVMLQYLYTYIWTDSFAVYPGLLQKHMQNTTWAVQQERRSRLTALEATVRSDCINNDFSLWKHRSRDILHILLTRFRGAAFNTRWWGKKTM